MQLSPQRPTSAGSARLVLVAAVAVFAVLAGPVRSAPLGVGTVVVSVSGPNPDPAGSVDIAALSLVEYTPAGEATGTVVSLPTTEVAGAGGTNYAIVGSQSATSLYGALKRSEDGRFLTISAANVPAATPAASLPGGVFSSTAFPDRTIARIDANGTVDTTTSFPARGTTPRGAASTDGTSIWWSANSGAGDSGGVRYVELGDTEAGPLLTGVGTSTVSRSNTNAVGIHAGQLYLGYSVSTFRGVYSLGEGLPQAGGPLPASQIVGLDSISDFFFADSDTLYVAVSNTDPTTPGLGLQKWSYSAQSQTWTSQWTANPVSLGLRGLAGVVTEGGVDIYAVTLADTLSTTPNALLRLSDTLAGTTFPAGGFTTLATSDPGTLFRGVAIAPVPEPTTLPLLAGCLAAGWFLRGRSGRSVGDGTIA